NFFLAGICFFNSTFRLVRIRLRLIRVWVRFIATMAGYREKFRIPVRIESILGWILLLASFAVFISFPNVNESNGDVAGWVGYIEDYANADGSIFFVTESRSIDENSLRRRSPEVGKPDERKAEPGWWVLWNPHHILYLPVTAFIFRIVRYFAPMLGGITFLQLWNAIAASLTVFFLYRLLSRIIPGSPYIFPWCVLLASSVTFVHYATDGAQYPTPVLLITIGSGSLFAFLQSHEKKYLSRSGIWFALAVLFHQLTIIIVPFIALYLWLLLRERRQNENIARSEYWIFPLIGLGIPIVVYLIAGILALLPTGELSLTGLFKYATLYGHQEKYWSDSLAEGVVENLYSFPGLYMGNARTHSYILSRSWFLLLVLMMFALQMTTLIVSLIKKAIPSETREWVKLCVFMIFPLFIFLSLWTPGNEFYHLFLIVPVSSFIVIGIESLRKGGIRGIIDTTIFIVWCCVIISINIPLSFSGAEFAWR
ncbi:MAG: hypothetical protein ABIC40_06315, partial [bacterium]